MAQGKPLKEALFGGKDPTIPLVLMEDISALIGLTLAFIAVGLSALSTCLVITVLFCLACVAIAVWMAGRRSSRDVR